MIRLSLVLLAFLCLAVACGGGGDDAPGGDPSAADILSATVRELPGLQRFHFKLEHENGTTRMPLNLDLETAEGDVIVPDRLSAEIEARAGRVPVRVRAIGIGDRAWITNPFTRQWQRLPGTVTLRDIADPPAIVAAVVGSLNDTRVSGREQVDGTEAYVIEGTLDSGALRDAFGFADAGLTVDVRLWVGIRDSLPRRVRLAGAMTRDETADVVRLVSISRINQPVQIEPPE